MARYALIPLEFQELDKGLERELVIDRTKGDLYILDDYKIPLSITAMIRDAVNGMDDKAKSLYDKIKQQEGLYYDKVVKIMNLGHELDDLIYNCETGLFKRIESLNQKSNYLDERFGEVKASFENIKSYLDDEFNKYIADMGDLLKMIRDRYNKANELYLKYLEWVKKFKETIEKMRREITTLDNKIKLKLDKLGNGSGDFSGHVEVTKVKVYYLETWFYWLSDNPITYPGRDDYRHPGTGQVGPFPYSLSPPCRPNYFAAGVGARNVVEGSYDKKRFKTKEEAYEIFETGWNNGIINTRGDTKLKSIRWEGQVLPGSFLSHTSTWNDYGKKCVIRYELKIEEKVEEDFDFEA